jgi:hypothetical protein
MILASNKAALVHLRNGLLLIPYWNIFHVSDFFLINKTFTFKLFLFSHKFGFVDNIWACLSAKMTTGIINESQKFWLPDLMEFVRLLNCTIDSDIKKLNHILLTLAKWLRWAKNETCIQNFSLKINWLNQLIMKLACLMQHRQKYEAKIVMKIWVLKLKQK